MVAGPQFFPSFRVRLNNKPWRLETRPVNLFQRRWPNRKCLRCYCMSIFSSCVSHRHRRHTSIVSKTTGNPLRIAAPLFNHEMIMFTLMCGRVTLLYDNEIVASTAVFASYIKRRVGVIHRWRNSYRLTVNQSHSSNTTAVTAMPSRRPTNPSPSVVVALMLIWF